MTDTTLFAKKAALREYLNSCILPGQILLVAYSGGVDSAFLAWSAFQSLQDRMMAVIADSPSLPRKELAVAIEFADDHGIPLRILQTHELEQSAYARNDGQRCFHCKDELFRVMDRFASEHGSAKLAYGRNLDDDGEFRPGKKAAERHGVIAPLAEAGLGKAEVRELARQAGLALWDKPASACLASRVELNREVTAAVLAQVEVAEESLHGMGLRQVRVRHHGEIARIEVEQAEMSQVLSPSMLDRIGKAVKAAGFRYVAVDVDGYRSGSMNALVSAESLLASAR